MRRFALLAVLLAAPALARGQSAASVATPPAAADTTLSAVADSAPPPAPRERAPTRAVAGGMAWSTGLMGAEYVLRSLPGVPWVGGAVGGGWVLGPSARLSVGLAPAGRRHVPYVGAGVLTNLYGIRGGSGRWRLSETAVLPTVDAGVQIWPAIRHSVYVDVGLSLGRTRDDRRAMVMPRLLAGGAF